MSEIEKLKQEVKQLRDELQKLGSILNGIGARQDASTSQIGDLVEKTSNLNKRVERIEKQESPRAKDGK